MPGIRELVASADSFLEQRDVQQQILGPGTIGRWRVNRNVFHPVQASGVLQEDGLIQHLVTGNLGVLANMGKRGEITRGMKGDLQPQTARAGSNAINDSAQVTAGGTDVNGGVDSGLGFHQCPIIVGDQPGDAANHGANLVLLRHRTPGKQNQNPGKQYCASHKQIPLGNDFKISLREIHFLR